MTEPEINNFIKPATPILDFKSNENGGICLDKENLTKLNQYIINLELVYK